jgi:ATP-dependent RNA helicase DeaD
LPKICEAGNITKDGIGAIRVQEDRTFVQILTKDAGGFGAGVELESGVTMTRLDGEPEMDRPERPARPAARPERKAPAPRAVRDDAPRDVTPREKPAYTPKPARVVEEVASEAPERKPRDEAYTPRVVSEKPSYAPRRDEAAPVKPRAKRDDAKPYAPRAAREDAPYKPYAAKADGDRKPYVKRDAADGAKPYVKREAAVDGAPKPRWAKADGAKSEGFKPKSAGFKSHGGSPDKPARAAGFKSHGAEGKTFAKPKPAAPKADAKDTSKRFVPPKKK